MKDCCAAKESELAQLRNIQGRTLKIVLTINAGMFLIEMASGIFSRSTSLMADSLDMLGDSIVYAFSLYVLHRGARARAQGAFLKGLIMAGFGVGVLFQAVLRAFSGAVPNHLVMGAIGIWALAANLVCMVLLYRHRADDLNMRSTWICSRNDIIANLGVLGAAGLVGRLQSNWPDLTVGTLIALLFLISAVGVLRDAKNELQKLAKPQ